MRLAPLVLAALLPACASPPAGGTTTGESTGDAPTGQDGSEAGPESSADASSSGSGSSGGEASTSSSSGDAEGSSSGGVATGSSTTSGAVDETTTTTTSSDSSSSSTTDPQFCGDLELDAGEECDDGNNEPSDGCDECTIVRWTHVGVAQEVPLAHLGKWKSCFSGTYEAGPKIQDILDACNGDHILMGCRPVDGTALTIAAHAPRADVFFEPQVNYDKGERHVANGVAWYWAPYYGLIGFEPHLGNDWWYPCSKPDQVEQMCWLSDSVQMAIGYRCGGEVISGALAPPKWLRVAYEAWD